MSQELEVDGKVRIGDDNSTPASGMIRFNQSTKDFEGFDGVQWWSLTGKTTCGNFNPTEENASNDGTILVYEAYQNPNFLSLELYPPDNSMIGSHPLGDNYSICSSCVRMLTGYDPNTKTFDKILLAREGTLNISSLTNFLEGTISDLILEEVTIDPNTFVSTPVSGGLEICLDQYSFNTAITCTNFNPTDESADNNGNTIIYQALEVPNLLTFELYPPDNSMIGSHNLGDNYSICSSCVRMLTGYDPNTKTFDKILLAREGTLNISSLTNFLEGTISDLVLEEVTIDPNSFVSTPVPGGLEICLDQFSFNTNIIVSMSKLAAINLLTPKKSSSIRRN